MHYSRGLPIFYNYDTRTVFGCCRDRNVMPEVHEYEHIHTQDGSGSVHNPDFRVIRPSAIVSFRRLRDVCVVGHNRFRGASLRLGLERFLSSRRTIGSRPKWGLGAY